MRRIFLAIIISMSCNFGYAQPWLKEDESATVVIGPFVDKTDGVTPQTDLEGSAMEADILISKAGGAFGTRSATTDPADLNNGYYSLALNGTDTSTVGELVITISDSSDHLPVWHRYMVVPANTYDALVSGSDALHADVTEWKGLAVPTPNVDGVPRVDVTHVVGEDATVVTDAVNANMTQLNGDSQSLADLKDFADDGYDPESDKITGAKSVDALLQGYNKALHVGTDQQYETIASAESAAVSGDLIVIHRGTYSGQTNRGKNGVTWYVNRGARIEGGGGSVPLFSGGVSDFTILGEGTIIENNSEVPMYVAPATANFYLECDTLDGSTMSGDVLIDASVASSRVTVKARRLISSSAGLGRSAGRIRYEFDTLDDSGGGLIITSGSGYAELVGGYAKCSAATLFFGSSGTVRFSGFLDATHAGSNGLNAPSGVTVVADSGSVKVPSGRPSLSGSGTIFVSDAFAYDTVSATATNIVRTPAQAILGDVRNGYNNVLHVGSGQTYADIDAAEDVAEAGDLIVVHSGTYPEYNIGKNYVTYYLAHGATLTGENGQDDEPIFSSAARVFRVIGDGVIQPSDEGLHKIYESSGQYPDDQVVIECRAIENVNNTTAFTVSNDGHLVVRAEKITSEMLFESTGGFISVESGRFVSDAIASVTGGAVAIIRSRQIEAAGDDLILGSGGMVVIEGTINATHSSSNGLNAPSGVSVVAASGSIKVPAGRPSLSGDGTIIVSDAVTYDASGVTATNVIRNPATSSVLVNTSIDGTPTSQTIFKLKAGPPDDNALNGAVVVVTDATNSTQKAVGVVDAYDGSDREVTLVADPGVFTMAAGDKVDVIAAK